MQGGSTGPNDGPMLAFTSGHEGNGVLAGDQNHIHITAVVPHDEGRSLWQLAFCPHPDAHQLSHGLDEFEKDRMGRPGVVVALLVRLPQPAGVDQGEEKERGDAV